MLKFLSGVMKRFKTKLLNVSKVSLVEIRSFLIHNYYIYDGLEKEERKTPYLDTLRYTLKGAE